MKERKCIPVLVLQAHVVKYMKNDSTGVSLQICKYRKFSQTQFSQENCFRRVSARNLLEQRQPVCKNSDMKNKRFFPDIELVIFENKIAHVLLWWEWGKFSIKRTAKKNIASKILIFRDPFSTVFIKQKQLTKHNYTMALEKNLSFCQVT